MKQFIKNLLDESTNLSTQRFSLIFILMIDLILSIVVVILCFQTANIIYINAIIDLILGTLGISLTGKVIQRFAENKNDEVKQ